MDILIVLGAIVLLVLLIGVFKINAFLSFLFVSVVAGIFLGIPLDKITQSVEKGIGDILGGNVVIIIAGAMLGKLIADTGAAQQVATSIVNKTGIKKVHWGVAAVGFIVGIPLFYNTGFVLLVPLIFSMVYQYKLPAVATGISMLAALSVAHGFLPPHPSPAALVSQFHADLGKTLLYGIVVAIPAIVLAGPVFSRFLLKIPSAPLEAFRPQPMARENLPSPFSSFFVALLPVGLFALMAVLPFVTGDKHAPLLSFLSQPSIVMLIALTAGTWILGIKRGKRLPAVMNIYAEAVKEVAMILLIIGGAGGLKQVLTDSGVSNHIATLLQETHLSPLFLGWLSAAIIRAAVGSATVAGFTAAGIIAPLIAQTHTDPNLMVLSIGAGSLMFSHVNDGGFWMFKEYFNVSIKDTLRSWSIMEIIVSVTGLIGVFILNIFIH
ncbi:gluconate:H+ symporter [Niabella soli]|uniref:Gnt-II system L-idonate transporter IdnT n=1 Tax=Niabella soli DSM 19437 TaxID=929713 RepID=W0F4Q6_9BACT|nr:gluconate:H+ symporter [Niabella soli]AHF16306.1 Gnt-II system L-idonate transporter IdnT [Niabella soli DSM 19437]